MGAAVDVLVAGAGPTGTAVAVALAERGLAVGLVAPAPDAAWRATYGAWVDELTTGSGTGPGTLAEQAATVPGAVAWPTATVADDDGARHLERPYLRLDTARLQAALRTRAEDAGVRTAAGTLAAVEHTPSGSRAVLRDGQVVSAALVVDATGHRATAVRRPPAPRPTAAQAAYGVLADFDTPPAEPGSVVLMDWSVGHLPVAERGDEPTFLYAMPLGGTRWFVEETSLARRPALPTGVLVRRLQHRLAARGARARNPVDVEHVRIPMDTPLPYRGQRVLAIGAAASAVHPATGYLLAATLRAVPQVADAVVAGLGGGGSPAAAAAAGWAALWPPDRVRARRLHAFGLEALLGMDGPTTRAFFRAFFATDPAAWSAYLSGRQSPAATLALMARVYREAPPTTRRALRSAALGPRGRLLAAALSGGLPDDPERSGRGDLARRAA